MKNRIREFREQRGMTQEQLGNLVGTSRQAINAIETEKLNRQCGLPMIFRVFLPALLRRCFF